eukprot:5386756-Amphidinium_carterae.1
MLAFESNLTGSVRNRLNRPRLAQHPNLRPYGMLTIAWASSVWRYFENETDIEPAEYLRPRRGGECALTIDKRVVKPPRYPKDSHHTWLLAGCATNRAWEHLASHARLSPLTFAITDNGTRARLRAAFENFCIFSALTPPELEVVPCVNVSISRSWTCAR